MNNKIVLNKVLILSSIIVLAGQKAFGVLLYQFKIRRDRFDAFFDLPDMLGRLNMLGQRSADSFNGIANLPAYVFMGLNGLLLSFNVFFLQFLTGLCHSELIGCKLGSVHSVHQVLFAVDTFKFFDILDTFAANYRFARAQSDSPAYYRIARRMSSPW